VIVKLFCTSFPKAFEKSYKFCLTFIHLPFVSSVVTVSLTATSVCSLAKNSKDDGHVGLPGPEICSQAAPHLYRLQSTGRLGGGSWLGQGLQLGSVTTMGGNLAEQSL